MCNMFHLVGMNIFCFILLLAVLSDRARPRHQHLAPTLALLGLGQADHRANGARPCPWTVYWQYSRLAMIRFGTLGTMFKPESEHNV